MARPLALPRSVASPFVYACGVGAFLIALYMCRLYGIHQLHATLSAMFAYGGTITLLELFVLRTPADPRNGLNFSKLSLSLERTLMKLLGIYASIGFVGGLYWLFPEYHFNIFQYDNGFYLSYGAAIKLVLPVVIVGALPYVLIVDGAMQQPHDRYYWLGRLLLNKPTEMTCAGLGQHLLSLGCRAFFMALCFVYASNNVNDIVDGVSLTANSTMVEVYQRAFNLIFALVMVITVCGNVLMLRLLGTHARSTDPTIFGWWICLFCFQPFKQFANYYFLPNTVNDPWIDALQNMPFFQSVWAVGLILILVLGVTADVTLGSRYSQLMNRGIVTNGLYRFTKHPSYFAAVLFILFCDMPPLMFDETNDILRSCFSIAGMALVFYLRARTEERHLARDADYVAYALWIEEHGVFRFMGQMFPLMRFTPPKEAPASLPYTGLVTP